MSKGYKNRCFKLMLYSDYHISRKCLPIFALNTMIKAEEAQLFGPGWSERVFKGGN